MTVRHAPDDASAVPAKPYTGERAEQVRRDFPAIHEGLVLFDGPGGTQLPKSVSDTISAACTTHVSNAGWQFKGSDRAEQIVSDGRLAVADLIGADPRGIAIGPNMTTMTYRFADTLAKRWQAGDDIVVTRLDHDANVRPWIQAAERRGVAVRWADIDAETCEMAVEQFHRLVGPRTRLVAVTGASNVAATRPDISAIADIVHAAGALLFVDGVHLTAHAPVDVQQLGADFYACSSYKFCGPHLGMIAADPALLADLHPDKLAPSPATVPERFEWGTAAFETIAALPATVDFLANLARIDPTNLTRRQRVLASMASVEHYEDQLASVIRSGIEALPGARLFGSAAVRTPTVSFRISGFRPIEVARSLGRRDICVADGHQYALELIRRLGIDEDEGVIRVGLAPYNTREDVDRLLESLSAVVAVDGAVK